LFRIVTVCLHVCLQSVKRTQRPLLAYILGHPFWRGRAYRSTT